MPIPVHQQLDGPAERALRVRLERWAVRSIGVTSADFDDVYQCAWRKLLEVESRGRETRNLECALRFGIRNSWLEECRRRRRKPFLVLEDVRRDPIRSEVEADPAVRLEALEQVRAAVRAITLTGERSARIILMRRVLGYSPQEICDALRVTRRTYRAEHASARRLLAVTLGR
jgi:RNA polymerase sigma factor (sigma-70 family)